MPRRDSRCVALLQHPPQARFIHDTINRLVRVKHYVELLPEWRRRVEIRQRSSRNWTKARDSMMSMVKIKLAKSGAKVAPDPEESKSAYSQSGFGRHMTKKGSKTDLDGHDKFDLMDPEYRRAMKLVEMQRKSLLSKQQNRREHAGQLPWRHLVTRDERDMRMKAVLFRDMGRSKDIELLVWHCRPCGARVQIPVGGSGCNVHAHHLHRGMFICTFARRHALAHATSERARTTIGTS